MDIVNEINEEILKDTESQAVNPLTGVVGEPEKPEETPEEPIKPPEETPEPETPPEPEETPTETKKPYETLSELLGVDVQEDKYETFIDDVKNIEKFNKAIKEQADKIKALEAEKADLINMYDPTEIFGSEEDAKYYALKKAHPDFDPSILSQVLSNNLDEVDAITAIALNTMLKDSDIYNSKQEVIESLESEYDIDLSEGLDSIEDGAVKRKLLKRAKDAKQAFNEIKKEEINSTELNVLNKKTELKQVQEEMTRKIKEEWTPFVEDLSNKLPDIEIKGEGYTFKYELGKEFRAKVEKSKEAILNFYTSKGEPTEDLKKGIVRELEAQFFYGNREAILTAYAEDYHARQVEEKAKKAANPKLKIEEATPARTDLEKSLEEAEAKILETI